MKILFFGDGPWAQIAFNDLFNISDIEVCGVILRYENPDKVLKKMAYERNIKVFIEKNINSNKFMDLCKSLNIDLGVSMSFNQIIKRELRQLIKNGVINCHAGKLPNYRGRNIINWALINDEKEIGITVHYVDDSIDTGDIISQAVIPIDEEDDYATLLNKAIKKCPEVLIDAICKIKDDRVNVIKQSHIKGSYFSYRRNGDEFIDWNWNSRRIHNFIRALAEPSPGAQTYYDDKKIYIWKSEETSYPNYISTPGEIIYKDKDGVVVKTGDSALKITLVSYEGDKKIIPEILVGKRLGVNLYKRIFELEDKINRLSILLKENNKL